MCLGAADKLALTWQVLKNQAASDWSHTGSRRQVRSEKGNLVLTDFSCRPKPISSILCHPTHVGLSWTTQNTRHQKFWNFWTLISGVGSLLPVSGKISDTDITADKWKSELDCKTPLCEIQVFWNIQWLSYRMLYCMHNTTVLYVWSCLHLMRFLLL